jgi:thymidine kinase
MKSGYLQLIIGPMFSGKSTELIRNVRLNKIINKKVLVIKPSIDNRYDSNRIVSHTKDNEDCIVVDDLTQIDNNIINDHDVIIIDEGQFFKNLKKAVLYWVDNLNKYVIIGGLDGDFERKSIGEINDLIPHADKYEKKIALCKLCLDGTNAIFSKRICCNNDQVLIGSDDLYIPVCRYHYNN